MPLDTTNLIAMARSNAGRLRARFNDPQDDPVAFAVVQDVYDLTNEMEADHDRHQVEAQNASRDSGRRLRLLGDIHTLLRADRVDEAIGVIVGEAEQSPALAERIGIRRLR